MLNIYKTQSAKDISDILFLADKKFDENVPCTLEEWVQWLMQVVGDEEKFGIWVGRNEEKELRAYIVVLDCQMPPISDSVMVLYYSFIDPNEAIKETQNAFEEIKKWAEERGAEKISLFTKHPRVMSTFGFIKEEGTPMTLNLFESEKQ